MSFAKNSIFLTALLLISVSNAARAADAPKTVCLNMIVKNESPVISRCLDSVLPFIDYWVIVDTGSTDGTQEVIKTFMKEKGIPGELYERPWVNFSHNRNEALKFAKGKADYIFVIDADEYLEYAPEFVFPKLDRDYYYMTLKWANGSTWGKIQLINNHLDWEYTGVLHEVICPPPGRTVGTFEKVLNIYTTDGARAKDPKKYEKDAAVLEAGLQAEPNNSRYVFYLAKSYACAKQLDLALKNYQRRVEMGADMPNDAEVFWSLFQIALLQEEMKMPPEVVIESYKRACMYNRIRVEPYFQLAKYYREQGDHQRAYHVASIGITIPKPKDIFFVEDWMYDYGIWVEYSICAYWVGRYKDCQAVSAALLKKDLPPNFRDSVVDNLGWANAKLLEKIVSQELVVEGDT